MIEEFETKMKCFKCNKEILKEESYFKMIEIENEKEIRIDYVHKICWNKFLKQIGSVEESTKIIGGLKKWFIKQGVLPEEKYTISPKEENIEC